MEDHEQFFISESIAHARSLPLPDCVRYLEGFLKSIGEDHPAASTLRSIYQALQESDQQLDLIQLGQLKLKLDAPAPKRRKRK
jgi:hypothetical protein